MSDLKDITDGIIINVVRIDNHLKSNALLVLYPRVLSKIESVVDSYNESCTNILTQEYALENRSVAEWAIPQKLLVYNCFVYSDESIPTAIYKLKQCEPAFKYLMVTEQYDVYAFMSPKETIEIIWPGIIFVGDINET